MTDGGGNASGSGSVAVVAIVVLVVLAVLAGGFMFLKGGGLSPTHAISGSISTPVGAITGQGTAK